MKIALLDYGMGNLRNVQRAFTAIGAEVQRVEHGSQLQNFDAIILPGVGNFGEGMIHLRERDMERPILDHVATNRPLLGICLGMQMLFESSEEAPGIAGLGIFKGNVIRFPIDAKEKVPHMGWNTVSIQTPCPMQFSFPKETAFYFVHTYHVNPKDADVIAATSDYIHRFPAAVGRANVYATQFHPEKSQDAGLALLKYFVQNISKG